MPLPKPSNFKETMARDSDLHRRKRRRNLALLAALVCLMGVFYLVTVVRIQAGLGAAG